MVIAEYQHQRFTVDNLKASPAELTNFLKLFFKSEGPDKESGCCRHIPSELAPAVARMLADGLVELTGGLLSFIITIIRSLYYANACFKGTAKIEDPTSHARDILAKVNDPRVQLDLKKTRLVVVLSGPEQKALVSFIRDKSQHIGVDIAAGLQKKALLRVENGKCVPWSPLVFDILASKLLKDPEHPACTFTKTVIGLVEYIVESLSGRYRGWVYDEKKYKAGSAAARLHHEDEINSAISSILKQALGEEGVHRGPAKKSTKQQYSQVDHAIYWNEHHPTLIETCLADVPAHVMRFGSSTGSYPKNYQFGRGIVLVINFVVNPKAPDLANGALPTKTDLFHVNVPSFKLKQYKASQKKWGDPEDVDKL